VLALPVLFSRLSSVPPTLLVPPMPLVAWAAGYITTSPLGTLLTTECASHAHDLFSQITARIFFLRSGHAGTQIFVGKKKEGGTME